jgi:hypothetical protein
LFVVLSRLKDWNLKAENIVPHGVNPLYFPIVPGHKHVHERPDHPDGHYRKETVVLDATEDFDIPGCAGIAEPGLFF